MSRPVKITADTPCDIGPMLQERYDVELIPLHVTMNDQEYLDGVNITNDMIYENWEKTGSLPKTSAVSVGEYEDVFQKYVDQGCDVVHFSLGSGLSVTHQNAVMAAEEIPGVYVEMTIQFNRFTVAEYHSQRLWSNVNLQRAQS